jgi:hypothetical protein
MNLYAPKDEEKMGRDSRVEEHKKIFFGDWFKKYYVLVSYCKYLTIWRRDLNKSDAYSEKASIYKDF